MKKVTSLLFLLYSQATLASWSGFAVVTPESQTKYDIDIDSVVSPSGVCTLKFEAIEYPYKHAWLILASSKLSAKEQDLRDFIWNFAGPPNNLVLKSKLKPASDKLQFMDDEIIDAARYEISITNQVAHRAYVYIDYPHPVDDGGYYYSIDLGVYCGW